MELMVTWPERPGIFTLDEKFVPENPAKFCPVQGTLIADDVVDNDQTVHFYWMLSIPVIVNRSREYLCRVDARTLPFGQALPLKAGMEIQIGHYQLQTQQGLSLHSSDEARLKRAFSSAIAGHIDEIPELTDLLPHMGHHIAWHESLQDISYESNPLKTLANEYKNVVLWGEQSRTADVQSQNRKKSWSPESNQFITLREKMRSKTVTDCILDSPFLMEKVFSELELSKQGDLLLAEEPKHDILQLVAPSHLNRRSVSSIPSLMLQEFYKAGLDTLW